VVERASATEYLKDLYEELLKPLVGRGDFKEALSIIVFGSASRPEDFVVGVSDVDVLVLVSEKPQRRHLSFEALGSRVDVVVLAVGEFKELVELGDPLAFMAERGLVLWGSRLDELLLAKPRVTERTHRCLRRSALAALGLAVESYLASEEGRALTHLYHAVRHLIRYEASLQGLFPVSDREVLEASKGEVGELYWRLVEARRRHVDRGELKSLLSLAVEVLAKELRLIPAKLEVLEKEARGGGVVMVKAAEDGGCLVFKAVLLDRTLTVKGGEVGVVDSRVEGEA